MLDHCWASIADGGPTLDKQLIRARKIETDSIFLDQSKTPEMIKGWFNAAHDMRR